MTTKRYTWRTDAAAGTVNATSARNALWRLIEDGEWHLPDSRQERLDISDGAWLTIFNADSTPALRRGIAL
jgi:hypothetical protein